MDLRKIKKLIELLEGSDLAEMEITEGDNTIRLTRSSPATAEMASLPPYYSRAFSPEPVVSETTAASLQKPAEPREGKTIDSPMVGTFYDAASPDAEPYVTIGSTVSPGDILCIIEAMKTFNQLEADTSGVIRAIYKSNGDPVEFGEPLFVIE